MSRPGVEAGRRVKRFGVRTAVAGVSLRLKASEVLGPNGAGKTTLRLPLGLLGPDEGQARLLGQPPRRALPGPGGRPAGGPPAEGPVRLSGDLPSALEDRRRGEGGEVYLLPTDYLATGRGRVYGVGGRPFPCPSRVATDLLRPALAEGALPPERQERVLRPAATARFLRLTPKARRRRSGRTPSCGRGLPLRRRCVSSSPPL